MNLHLAARQTLQLADPDAKMIACEALWRDWNAARLNAGEYDETEPLMEAGRPQRPILVAPEALPRRELNGAGGHMALIHALTHIEFNAINLALDAVYRFRGMPRDYYRDWLQVAWEEAQHFQLLRDHLRGLGREYGDFPAHDGLWSLARRTAADPLARMALVPRLMEARGLDATPALRAKLAGFGDHAGAAILDIVLRDEVSHVAIGDRWFRWLCAQRGQVAESVYFDCVTSHD